MNTQQDQLSNPTLSVRGQAAITRLTPEESEALSRAEVVRGLGWRTVGGITVSRQELLVMPPDAEAWIHEKLARRLEGYRYDRITVHPVTHLDMVRYYAQVQDEVIRGG